MITLLKFFLTVGSFLAVHFSLQALPVPNTGGAGLMREIDRVDDPDILSPGQPLQRSLIQLNSAAGKKTQLTIRPWANGAWKTDAGLIAARYADSEFMRLPSFRQRSDYFSTYSMSRILRQSDAYVRSEWIDVLSPAEKYELLVGDRDGTLSQALWAEGEKFHRAGTLAHWMGICEGSAAASVLFPEPRHAVDVWAPDGTPVRFHVMDIKGLAGLVWSAYNAKIPIAGSRCSLANMTKDARGIVINEGCFNNNPGAFHIAALNYIGLRKIPFFINRDTHTQVWNSPVLGYEFHYFNPRNGAFTASLDGAMIKLADYPNDRFRQYRASQASSLVGVEMRIRLAKGSTTARDEPAAAAIAELKYTYDLEVDTQGIIVGGEWHSANHPDFMWAVEPGFEPRSYGDLLLGGESWNGSSRVPAEWLPAIRQSSSRNQPLYLIVKKLVEMSSR